MEFDHDDELEAVEVALAPGRSRVRPQVGWPVRKGGIPASGAATLNGPEADRPHSPTRSGSGQGARGIRSGIGCGTAWAGQRSACGGLSGIGGRNAGVELVRFALAPTLFTRSAAAMCEVRSGRQRAWGAAPVHSVSSKRFDSVNKTSACSSAPITVLLRNGTLNVVGGALLRVRGATKSKSFRSSSAEVSSEAPSKNHACQRPGSRCPARRRDPLLGRPRPGTHRPSEQGQPRCHEALVREHRRADRSEVVVRVLVRPEVLVLRAVHDYVFRVFATHRRPWPRSRAAC